MNLIIFLIIAILYLVLFGITFGNMKVFDIKTKVIYLIIGIIINLIITFMIISLSKINIQNSEAYKYIKNIDTLIFTAVNSIITLPTIGRYINNIKMEIMSKEKLNTRMVILAIIYIIILVLEVKYIKGLEI